MPAWLESSVIGCRTTHFGEGDHRAVVVAPPWLRALSVRPEGARRAILAKFKMPKPLIVDDLPDATRWCKGAASIYCAGTYKWTTIIPRHVKRKRAL